MDAARRCITGKDSLHVESKTVNKCYLLRSHYSSKSKIETRYNFFFFFCNSKVIILREKYR